jgi:hypothetical protein
MIGLGLNIAKSTLISEVSAAGSVSQDPIVWFNEESLINYSVDQPVAVYEDISGNNFMLEQPFASKQPVVKIIENKKALYFTNDTLINSDHPILQGGMDFTIVYVGRNLSSYHTAVYVGDNDAPSNTSSFRLGRNSGSSELRAVLGDGAGGAFAAPFGFTQSGVNDIAYAYKRGLNSSDIYIGLDNGNTNSEIQFGVPNLTLNFGHGLGIGTNNPDDPLATGTGNNWYLLEAIVYNRALDEQELIDLRTSLRTKWNV